MESGHVYTSYEAVIQQSYEDWQNSDPESLAIHGFDFEEVSYGKSLKSVAEEIQFCFTQEHIHRTNAVFICQNPSFDRAFFAQIISPELQEKKEWPYHWLDFASMFWSLALERKKKDFALSYPWEQGLSKNKIAKSLHLFEEERPHRAMNGARHLLLCYEALLGFPKKS